MGAYELLFRLLQAGLWSMIAAVLAATAAEALAPPEPGLRAVEIQPPPPRLPGLRVAALDDPPRTSPRRGSPPRQRSQTRLSSATSPRPTISRSRALPVERIGDDAFALDRQYAIEVIENPSPETFGAQVRPVRRGLGTTGLRLLGVRRGSLYAALGLRSGDVLQGVNGRAIDGPNRLMELYQALRDEDRFALEVRRGRETRTFSYELR